MFARAITWIESRGPVALAGVALVLSLPALALGFQLDDHLLRAGALSPEKLPLWDVPDVMLHEQRQRGFWAWWSSPHLKVGLFRPLTWWTHRLDFYLWPDSSVPMALLNCLIYAATVWIAACVYRRVFPESEPAVLAALMFAVNDAHATSVGWIACRNALLAVLFSTSALALHVRARQERSAWLRFASAGMVALALLSGESGVVSLCYLVAYAWVCEPGPLRERAWSVAPQLVIGVVWVAHYFHSGFGMHATSWYRDPLEPHLALTQGVADVPLWFVEFFGLNVLTTSLMVPPFVARLAALPFALVLAWLLLPVVRESKPARFFACATALALGPLLLTTPQDRLAINASFAAFGWLAVFIVSARNSARVWVRRAGAVLLAINVWAAAFIFPAQLTVVQPLEHGLQAMAAATPRGVDQVVLLNSPMEIIENEVPYVLGMDRRAPGAPESFHTLYAGGAALEVHRVDERTLDVRVDEGWGAAIIGRIMCALRDLPKLHEERQFRAMSTRVLEVTAADLPRVVRFQFATPLEAATRGWLVWRGRKPEPWTPPPVGERVSIAATPLASSIPLPL